MIGWCCAGTTLEPHLHGGTLAQASQTSSRPGAPMHSAAWRPSHGQRSRHHLGGQRSLERRTQTVHCPWKAARLPTPRRPRR